VLKHGLSIMRPLHPKARATVLLQPTSPLRTPGDVHNAVDLFDVSDSVWLASVSRVVDAHPSRMYRKRFEGSLGEKVWQEPVGNLRQDLEALYLRNGAVYIYDNESLERGTDLTENSPVLFEMPEERSKNIDTYLDLKIVEFILESRHAENRNT
jgi:CMP-N,N'-diacetyllegionaminic acid synthase